MKPVYLMIGPALLGACLVRTPRTRIQEHDDARRAACQPAASRGRPTTHGPSGPCSRRSRRHSMPATPRPQPQPSRAGALVVDEEGQRTLGRAAIRDQFATSFKNAPGSTIAIQVDSLRFLGTETALEEGRATITPGSGAGTPEISRFTAIYVKEDGHWLQAAVRDEPAANAQRPRPPQGAGMAGRRMGQREPGGGRLHHLQVGRQRQFPAPRVHRQGPGQARDERLAEDRLGPGQASVQVVGLRYRGRLCRSLLDP